MLGLSAERFLGPLASTWQQQALEQSERVPCWLPDLWGVGWQKPKGNQKPKSNQKLIVRCKASTRLAAWMAKQSNVQLSSDTPSHQGRFPVIQILPSACGAKQSHRRCGKLNKWGSTHTES